MSDIETKKTADNADTQAAKELVADKKSIALERLIAEISDNESSTVGAYNRTYHRHNR
jgi:hypothetical protein